jgi:hypothetical protein
MRRPLAVAAPLAVVALAVVPAAQAKGPTSATISGPGLEEPVRLAALSEGQRLSRYWQLVEGLGFFPAAFGQITSPLLPARPAGDLGPRYTIRYGLPMGYGRRAVVVQHLYPYADGGPATYMPPGQKIFGHKTRGGWYRAAPGVKAALLARGLPAARPPAGTGTGTRNTAAVGVALIAALLGVLGPTALRRRARAKPA